MQPPRPSAIYQLPAEILIEIFLCYFLLMKRSIQSSFQLSSVCSQWRSVSIGVPILWSHIDIPNLTRPGALPLIHLLLTRSSRALLDISIDVSSSELLDLLSQHISRWRSLRFRLDIRDNWVSKHSFFAREDLALHHLEEFYFEYHDLKEPRFPGPSGPLVSPLQVLFLKNANRLHTFHWCIYAEELDIRNVIIPAQIRDLSITRIDVNDARFLLDHYPTLESVVLGTVPPGYLRQPYLYSDYVPRIVNSHLTTSSALTRLNITSTSCVDPADDSIYMNNIDNIFKEKLYPHLTSVHLCAWSSLIGINAIPLLALSLSSNLSLRELTLNGVTWDSEELEALFERCPVLEKLDLWDTFRRESSSVFFRIPEDLIERLTFPSLPSISESSTCSSPRPDVRRTMSGLNPYRKNRRTEIYGSSSKISYVVPARDRTPLLPHLTALRIYLAEEDGPDRFRAPYRPGFDLDLFISMLESRCQIW